MWRSAAFSKMANLQQCSWLIFDPGDRYISLSVSVCLSSSYSSKRNSTDDNAATDAMSLSMNDSMLTSTNSAGGKLPQRCPSTFKLERSQSDITFNSANLPQSTSQNITKKLLSSRLSSSLFKALIQVFKSTHRP